jgi:hypothetical protein
MDFYSLEAYGGITAIQRNKCYQLILASLSDRNPKSREAISRYTGLRLQTVCGRVKELKDMGILEIQGELTTSSGRKAGAVGLK